MRPTSASTHRMISGVYLFGALGKKPLIDTNQPAREGSGIFIRSQKIRDPVV